MEKMNRKHLEKKLDHLKCFNTLKPKDKLAVVDICSDDCIHAVCETTYNYLQGAIPLKASSKSKLKAKLMPIRLQVRKLADSKVSVKEKRNLLKDPQVGKGIFSLIAGVLPLLISALTPK